MKKDAYRMFYGAAMVLTTLFVLCCLGGWVGLRTTQSATPFWALALVRAVELLLPAAVFFGLGFWIRRKGH